MSKKLTKREMITEEVNFKVKQMMENKVSKIATFSEKGSWCDTCHHWRKKKNSKMKYCSEHQKEFDELLKDIEK